MILAALNAGCSQGQPGETSLQTSVTQSSLGRDRPAAIAEQERLGLSGFRMPPSLQSSVLEDVCGDIDDIQKEFDEAGSAAGVDSELVAQLDAHVIGGPGVTARLGAYGDQRQCL